ncbi:MAG: ATP-binding protein [Bacteroidales bacterium]|nr:ATP-binding protein [Bacteroidales bacterium]
MNTYEKLSSKVKRIIIPLPDFKFSHRTSQSMDIDDRFVGRRNIMALLKNWLDVSPKAIGKDFTGSYLITGYRGMGKTSFVERVIDELREKQKTAVWEFGGDKPQRKAKFALRCMLPSLLLCLGTIVYMLLLPIYDYDVLSLCAKILLGITISGCLIYVLKLLFVTAPKFRKTSRTILKIKVNIGDEVSNVRDVLSLLAYSIRDRLQEHVDHAYIISPTNIAIKVFRSLLIGITFVLIMSFSIDILSLGSVRYFTSAQDSFVYHIIEYINNVGLGLKSGSYRWAGLIFGAIIGYLVSYMVWLVIRKVILSISTSWKNLIYAHPSYFLDRINDLCHRIDSSVSEDNSPNWDLNVTSYISLVLRRKMTRQYTMATVREIEHELIELIRYINLSRLLQCRFIVVLDELDKLCVPTLNSNENRIKRDATNLPEFSNDNNGMSDEMSSNEKRHRILAFLSQLKYFVSTAEAKFIFIAGHELYDAYKADVSDREFSISSVFNGVINVNSFFSYDSRIKDVTRMTETYLCRVLFGREKMSDTAKIERDTFRLSEYKKRISIDNDVDGRELQTVICFLKQFVTYLTFVSNGAPKKLNARLERYVVSSEKYNKEHAGADDCIVVRLKEGRTIDDIKFYLSFGYHDQQKVGFVHYMAAPIFENIISPSSDYGDKFLVSSSFLIAHIYKHHKSGFSWRNLEYLPDLIDNNRTPELREFINAVIDYLGKIHLTNITSGIFAYKFPMKLAEEVAIFTKKSDELSAIFNFSLDYFSSVKKYYYRLIDFYSKRENELFMSSAVHHNLGDIHMANDEYSEAIIQYRYAASNIERDMTKFNGVPEKSGELASCIVRYIRIMMKLAHAYEKRNTIDSAHLIYTAICSKLVAYREIDENSLGLKYYYVNTKESCRGKSDSVILTNIDNNMFSGKNDTFIKQCYPNVIDNRDTFDWKFWIHGKEIVNNLSEHLTPQKHALITKLSVFEDLRMAYLPILSKLWALEKYNICGITDDNIKLAESEFMYMYIITNSKDKNLLRIDFYRKLGDILYYKNKSGKKVATDSLMNMMNCWGYDFKSIIFNYCYRNEMSKSQISLYKDIFDAFDLWKSECKDLSSVATSLSIRYARKVKEMGTDLSDIDLHSEGEAEIHFKKMFKDLPSDFEHDFSKFLECSKIRQKQNMCPCYACRYYKRSLMYLKEHLLQVSSKDSNSIQKSDSLVFLYALENRKLSSYRFNELIQTALTLESMGNVMLSCSKVDGSGEEIDKKLITELFEFSEKEIQAGMEKEMNTPLTRMLTHLEKALLYYWTAMRYYTEAGNHKESMQTLTKIFNMLSSYHAASFRKGGINVNIIDDAIWPLVDKTLCRQIADIAKVRMCDNVAETVRLRRILNTGNIRLELTSIMPEIEELLVAYYELKLSQIKDKGLKNELIAMLYDSSSLRYLRNDSMIYNRVISLMLKARLNEKVFEMLGLVFKEKSDDSSLFMNISDKNIHAISKLLRADEVYDKDDLLAFLIVDSMFCLLNVAGILQSSVRTTLFSNSFCYGVYDRLYHWVRWQNRIPQNTSLYKALNDLKDRILEGHHKLLLTPEYMVGMARRYVEAVYSTHGEGVEYQNFIRNLYVLDDDLQNNTCQFYFALEKMKINSDFFNSDPLYEESFFNSFSPDLFYLNVTGKPS